MEKVKITLRRKSWWRRGKPVYVAVNGEEFRIKRGKEVEVPDYVAEVLQHRDEAIAAHNKWWAER